MAHTHHCKVCLVAVGICDGSCRLGGEYFCTLHHPDPVYHKDWRPYMTHPIVRAVEDKEFILKQAETPKVG